VRRCENGCDGMLMHDHVLNVDSDRIRDWMHQSDHRGDRRCAIDERSRDFLSLLHV
jgi:hypothetical protein